MGGRRTKRESFNFLLLANSQLCEDRQIKREFDAFCLVCAHTKMKKQPKVSNFWLLKERLNNYLLSFFLLKVIKATPNPAKTTAPTITIVAFLSPVCGKDLPSFVVVVMTEVSCETDRVVVSV